jgi:glycosyltransferase involved in cell wall biosynthesis
MVWTLHDMWPFTGGCHYTKSCKKYEYGCEACPHLGSDDPGDLSHSTWTRKHEAWGDCELTVVAPSHWLADCARDSALLGDARIEVIPNGLDTTAFRPQKHGSAHRHFGVDKENKLVCFGADWTTQRKGMDLLYDALDALETPATEFTVVVFGRGNESAAPETDVDVRTVGFIGEEDLRVLYSDAAVAVVPSRQEAFGQTASEALTSGTPVVAFDATGPRDIVDHEVTGYLAEPFDSTDLARGIDWVLSDEDRLARLSERARSVAESRFDIGVVARQYRALYDELV